MSLLDKFIKKANLVHNGKFTYEKVKYVNSTTPVIITCPIHGDYYQRPEAHLNRVHACIKCYNENRKKMDLVEFIRIANELHKFSYTYNKSQLITLDDKICVTCPTHGDFYPIAGHHIRRSGGKAPNGCSKCASDKKRITLDEFILKSNITHNNKYDYTKTILTKSSDMVTIICPIHGEFIQDASNHMHSRGCRLCNSNPMDTDKFKELANKKHGNRYSYDKTIYIGNKKKLIIECKLHGEFKQTPYSHLSGSGCPICRQSHKETFISNILTNLNIKYLPQYRFSECKYKKPLPFDFYLPDLNICIEYQGEQHYYPANIWKGDEKTVALQQLRDSIKKEYCKLKGIKLVEIKYTVTDDEIISIINGFLSK